MPTKLVCAWCGSELGTADVNPLGLDEISHGICPACYNTQVKQIDTMKTNATINFSSNTRSLHCR
jgi:hypothetical protein